MNCQSCGHESPAANRFCEECGATLVRRCGRCGSDVSRTAKFCGACGASLVSDSSEKAEARKVVTIVFADLIGSTSLHERLDPESVSRVMDRYHRAVRVPVETHGGTVVQLLGDGVMCAFGVPRVAEDDAIRAVRAAVGIQHAFREFAHEHADLVGNVGLRVAVNTGEVVVSDDYTAGIGDPLNVAARLQQEARDGDVLIGESTERLVRDRVTLEPFGVFQLKGRAESVAAFRVVSLERPAGIPATPFVGREDELRRIMAVFDSAVAARRARMAVILGSPGLGKSRLIDEVSRLLTVTREAANAQPLATVLTAHCDAAGGTTFAPVAKALRSLVGNTDDTSDEALRVAIEGMLAGESERSRIAAGIAALLGNKPAPPEETFFVVRRFLAALAAAQPVVLVIDDLQWAEPLLLDLAEHLVQWSTGTPLLVLVAARPELRDVRSSLTAPGGLVNDVLTLGGLDAAAATRLAANVIGAEQLPAALAGRVLATSEGNPLFVGELVRMLVHEGALKRDGDRWTAGAELANLEMPPTIHALLAARIESLRPEERTVLERAAVVGRHFSRTAVARLLPREVADLDLRLEALRRSELIEPAAGWFLGEPLLRFHHVLIRDAAYRRLLKETRAELHGRLADWIESRVGDALEHDETIGWHLEQAHRNLRDLGPLDEHGRAFGERASRHLAAAGRRALARDDLPLAASLLGRAIDRLDPDDPARADLALDWCEALLAAGDVGPASEAVAELGRFVGDKGLGGYAVTGLRVGSASSVTPNPLTPNPLRLQAWHTCFTGQLAVLTDPQTLRGTADALAAAGEEFVALGDANGEAKAHSVLALALSRLGKIGAGEAALDRALAAARRAGDRRRANAVLAGAPLAALWGPSPVTRASGRCLDVVRVLRITLGSPAVEAVALRCQAVLEALRGRTDAARRMLASSRQMVEELGITQQLLETEALTGFIELLDGDAPSAERCLRTAYDGLRGHGLGIDAARAAALLGRALLAQDRAAEAEALSHESEALAGDDLKAAIAWRGVRAEALARRGEHAAAFALARAAVGIASATDALLDHADARLSLATALRAAGRNQEAEVEEQRAIELWEAKGATLLVERIRRDALAINPSVSSLAAGRTKQAFAQAGPVRRRVWANAATANAARMDAAAAARDLEAFLSQLADAAEGVHHPTGAVYHERDSLPSYRMLLASEDLQFAHEWFATLGDALALCRGSVSFGALDALDLAGGAASFDSFSLLEVDASGRRRRTEFFAIDRLGDAVTRLYERHAELLPDGPERVRAAATARAVAALLGPFDLERYAVGITPAVEFVDHRTVGFPSGRGVEDLLRSIGTLLETADDVTTRVDDILALGPDAFLLRWTTSGTDRVSRGPFEWQFLRLCVFDAAGLLTRAEQFDADDAEWAFARFDALASNGTAPEASLEGHPFANAAARALLRNEQFWDARDWEGLVASMSPEFRMDDRRALVGVPLSRDEALANLRMMFDMPGSRWQSVLRATRGTRLALLQRRLTAGIGTDGGVEFEHLSLVEVDAAERYVALVIFDADDVDAAYAELDDRYAAGEGAPYAELLTNQRRFLQASAARDWDAVARLLPEDFTLISHRRLVGTMAPVSRDEYLATRGSIDDLGLQGDLRLDHLVRVSTRAIAGAVTWFGTLDGGDFETSFVILCAHDGSRFHAVELYDLDQLDAALARYEELAAVPTGAPFANAAARSVARMERAWHERKWEEVVASIAPTFQMDDRRALVGFPLSGGDFIANMRMMFDLPNSSWRNELRATRGERLALLHCVLSGGAGVDSQVEFEHLSLVEVDAAERYAVLVIFDPDEVDAAYAELDDRYAAGDATTQRRAALTRTFCRAFAARDWGALAALLASDLVVTDRRILGWETLYGPDAYIQALQSLVDLASDVQLRVDHLTMYGSRFLYVTSWRGTHEGGVFESPSAMVCELDDMGRIRRFDQYDIAQLDEIRARFEQEALSAIGGRQP